VIPMDGRSAPRAYLRTPFNEAQGTISPDNRWMAYVSDESGRPELYVDTFPDPRRKRPVGTAGARLAWWRADSGQLLIASADRTQLLLAEVSNGPEVSISAPRVVGSLPKGVVALDATADLQRLVAIVEEGVEGGLPMTVVQNWTALLNAR